MNFLIRERSTKQLWWEYGDDCILGNRARLASILCGNGRQRKDADSRTSN